MKMPEDIHTINVHELKKLWESNAKLCVIDVREDHEWQEFRIPGATHIPKNELPNRIEEIFPEREQPVYLHCRGGVRSIDAARALIGMGYQEVYSIDGGIKDWEFSGYPIEK